MGKKNFPTLLFFENHRSVIFSHRPLDFHASCMVIFYSKSILLMVVAILVSSVGGIDDKCTACNAIAEELDLGLLKEKPRNHFDHRLDSKDQREGKLIDYGVSELIGVELLDVLCEKMQDYTLEKVKQGRRRWIKMNNWD